MICRKCGAEQPVALNCAQCNFPTPQADLLNESAEMPQRPEANHIDKEAPVPVTSPPQAPQKEPPAQISQRAIVIIILCIVAVPALYVAARTVYWAFILPAQMDKQMQEIKSQSDEIQRLLDESKQY